MSRVFFPFRSPRPALLVAACLLALLLPAFPERSSTADEDAPQAAPTPTVPVHASLRPLKPWLMHVDWTVRSFAAFDLRRRSETGAIYLATRMLSREPHAYAAACALRALRGRPRRDLVLEGGSQLVDALLQFGRNAHPTVAKYAREVLATMPPIRLGVHTELAIYEGWWKRGRKALSRERKVLLEALANDAARLAVARGKTSTSTAPTTDDRFYGRLELMRRHGLELCVVMDHTGSMGPVISVAKRRAAGLLRRLRAYVPQFRAGLVTYDDAARLRIPLTQDADLLAKAFRKVGAGGGGDFEEGVDKGIRTALRQERLGWSQRAHRVIVVVGDAPPHDGDVPGLLRSLKKARSSLLFDHAIAVHTVSTTPLPVLHFQKIALAGGGQHVTLTNSNALVEELVLLTFGGPDRARIKEWMHAIDALRAAEPKPGRPR